MKKIIFTTALLIAIAAGGYAQNKHQMATWVIEGARHSKIQTVKFYDDASQLIYQETVSTRLNPSKKKVQQKLNHILDSLVSANGISGQNDILTASFKRKK